MRCIAMYILTILNNNNTNINATNKCVSDIITNITCNYCVIIYVIQINMQARSIYIGKLFVQ